MVARRRLVEAEARAPAQQVALERQRVIGELPRTHIVRRAPVGRPVARRAERQIQVGRLPPRGVAQLWRGVTATARARQRNAERKTLSPAVAPPPPGPPPRDPRPALRGRASLAGAAGVRRT